MAPGRDILWNTRAKDENGREIFIPQKEAASYIDGEFCLALEVFCTTETLGCLPFAGGWAEQPAWITRALAVLKAERLQADGEESEMRQREEEDARKYGRR